MFAVSACSSSDDSDEAKASPSATSSAAETPTPSSADPEAAAKDELLASYQQYLGEVTKSYSQAGTDGTDIKKYATGAALATVQSETKAMDKAGQVTIGKPASTPEVTAINLGRKVPKATITDCMDVSQWKLVDRKTKNEVELPKERLTKYVDIISLEKWGKQWVVLKETPQERKC
ncbi:hypothetical protein ACWD4T_20455 [Streptomyces umbrinus]